MRWHRAWPPGGGHPGLHMHVRPTVAQETHSSPVPESKGMDRQPALVRGAGAPQDPPRGTEREAEQRSKLEARRT